MHAATFTFTQGCATALLLVLACAASGAEPTREELDFFEAKVRPVLAERCYECHSADSKKVKGGLLLDTREGVRKGGDAGPAIVPGDPETSVLIEAIGHHDKDTAMPPKTRLPEHEIAALTQWVKMGAPDPRLGPTTARPAAYDWEKERQHWAYQPVRDPAPPAVKDPNWARQEVDRFLLAKMEERGFQPAPDADPRTLIRRMTYDLTGLPPTPEEVATFTQAHATEAARSIERLADRLLASRQYGERWGRHWMDLVRYADTAGDNSDYPIPQAWRYRNYVIDAFNADKPFDQFIREQIAGDLLPATDQAQRNEQIIATGYVAQSRRFGSLVTRYPQHLTIEDTLDNMGKTFLGLGLSCARCHDHKFDAISQRDYYALYGIFESTRYAFPGIELLKVQKDFVPLLAPDEVTKVLGPQMEKERELQARQDEINARFKPLIAARRKLEERVAAAVGEEKARLEAERSAHRVEFGKLRGQSDEAGKAIEKLQRQRPPVPDAYAVQEAKPTDARLQLKGEPERVGELTPRRWLEVLGGQPLPPEAAKTSGRLELAGWIADAKNPLTARVLVNRVWQHHFGSGLVPTPNDFGVRGLPPTHPELLDWLATRFVADGWSLKRLHKRILLSRAYQLSSVSTLERQISEDPSQTTHWRASRRRLDAEALRDSLLAISGRMDWTPLAEPHPFPPPDQWEFTQHHPFRGSYPSQRRSVYLMTSRLTADSFFQTFDGPDRNATTPARDSSVTTVQALYLMNDAFVHEQAGAFAARLLRETSGDEARIDRAFALLLQRSPSSEERARLAQFLTAVRDRVQPVANAGDKSEAEAWASVARAIFRTNEFLHCD